MLFAHRNPSLYRPLGLQEVGAPRISRQSALEGGKAVSPTHRPPLPPGRIPGTRFCQRLSRPQGHNAARRNKSLKNSSDPIGNLTHDLPAFSAVPQPTAPPRTKTLHAYHFSFHQQAIYLNNQQRSRLFRNKWLRVSANTMCHHQLSRLTENGNVTLNERTPNHKGIHQSTHTHTHTHTHISPTVNSHIFLPRKLHHVTSPKA